MSRVGYVLKKFPRLSETFILTELLALEELGTPLVVYSLRPPDDPRFHAELSKLRAEIRYVAAGSFADALDRLARAEPGADAGGRSIQRLLELAMRAELRPADMPVSALLDEAAAAVRVAELARVDGVVHLHAHFATVAARVAHLASALAGIPYSVTGHAKDLYRTTVNFRLLDRLAGASQAFVTVCDANVAHLAARLSPAAAAKVRRIYNGIDVSAFAGGSVMPPKTSPPVVLSIGRLVRKKGLHLLLDAAAAIVGRAQRFDVRIVGDGPERESLRRQADAIGLRGRVEFCGAQPSDAVRRELAAATLFCLPCIPDDDGNQDALPTVLIEAMAAGVPCVSTTIGGIPEILDHSRAGALVAPGNVEALAEEMQALLADPVRREELARAGRARAHAQFDRRRAATELASVFAGRVQAVAEAAS